MRKSGRGGRWTDHNRNQEVWVAKHTNHSHNHASSSASQPSHLSNPPPTGRNFSYEHRHPRRPRPQPVHKPEVTSLADGIESFTFDEKPVDFDVAKPNCEVKQQTPGNSSSAEAADDVYSRLEMLQRSSEEPVLSEEQLSINDQLQEDEVSNCQ